MGLYELSAPLRAWRRRWHGARPCAWPRVDRVGPVPGRRLVAMTFDDGPTALRGPDGEALTLGLLRALGRFGMRGTFNMVGGTAANYPDRPGPLHTPLWNGLRHDHYPAYGLDAWAGMESQPALVRAVLDAGGEIGNHSFRHLAFGPERIVYGRRRHHAGAGTVRADCLRLQGLCGQRFGVVPTLARPPHYIARTADGADVAGLYRELGLTMVGASFDLGAWRARLGSRRAYAAAALAPLAAALERDGDALDGQILFAKDGLNMSLEFAVNDVLPEQLRLLHAHGYRVVPVSELVAAGRFADLAPGDALGEEALHLLRLGIPCAFADNTVRPDAAVTAAYAADLARALPAALQGVELPPTVGRTRRRWLGELHARLSA